MTLLAGELNTELKREQRFRSGLKSSINQAFDLKKKILAAEKELADETAKAEKKERDREEAKARRKEREAKAEAEQAKLDAKKAKEEAAIAAQIKLLTREEEKATLDAAKITEQAARIRIGLIDDETIRANKLFELEKNQLKNEIEQVQQQIKANEEFKKQSNFAENANLTEIELKEKIAAIEDLIEAKREDHSKKETKRKEKANRENQISAETISGYYISAADATSKLIDTVSEKNKKGAMIAYRIAQAAAVSEIAINTAKEISKVAANPFAVAGVAALGAAQLATVIATPPPEFHMGGLIKGDDTTQITALKGEAILDRRTVSRLGGEQGVNALQRGQSSTNEVIVVQPFKHFDKFVKLNSRRGGSMASIKRHRGAGVY